MLFPCDLDGPRHPSIQVLKVIQSAVDRGGLALPAVLADPSQDLLAPLRKGDGHSFRWHLYAPPSHLSA